MTNPVTRPPRIPAWAFVPCFLLFTFGSTETSRSADLASQSLKIGIVQMALGRTLEDNRERIVDGITKAADRQVRVVVFPEGALRGQGNDSPDAIQEAIEQIRQSARMRHVYVLFGGATFSTAAKRDQYWLQAMGPDGRDLFRYDKIYDQHRARMPGVFEIDGIPCSAFLCADRWLRGVEEIPIQQGARISFELSCNFAGEWVPPLEWYWYVPRALRNNIWVVFANTGNRTAGKAGKGSDPATTDQLHHGHSAVIAPDGSIAAASRDDAEAIIVADLDVASATRAGALARSNHPALQQFWQAGLKVQNGEVIDAPAFKAFQAPEGDITIAVAQAASDLAAIKTLVGQAHQRKADLIVFPARTISSEQLPAISSVAEEHRMTIVIGAEFTVDGGLRNSAFVVGPSGSVLTRYDQLSARAPFQPGTNLSSMWFRVKGVPAVVTIGADALWTELAELAAMAGAQIHVHLDRDATQDSGSNLRRLQIWSNLASFQTFSAMANVTGAAIWEDLRDADERRAEVGGLPRPDTGSVKVYSPFSANLIIRGDDPSQLLVATRRIGRANPHYPRRTSNLNPQMDPWYRAGARLIAPSKLP